MTTHVHDTSKISHTKALRGREKSKRNGLEHCGEKIMIKGGKRNLREVFFERGEERKEWYEISTREKQGNGKTMKLSWVTLEVKYAERIFEVNFL